MWCVYSTNGWMPTDTSTDPWPRRLVDHDGQTVPPQFGGCAKPAQPYGSRIRREKRKNHFATMSGKSSKPQFTAAPIRHGKAEPTAVEMQRRLTKRTSLLNNVGQL
jgi:hypothetical protein